MVFHTHTHAHSNFKKPGVCQGFSRCVPGLKTSDTIQIICMCYCLYILNKVMLLYSDIAVIVN